MKISEILKQPSMPIAGPSYPPGQFVAQIYLTLQVESDPLTGTLHYEATFAAG